MTRTTTILSLLAALALAALPRAAAAQRTYIEVGSPNFKPLPIAVAPFGADGGAATDATEIWQTVRSDLALSGLFDLLDPKSFLADPAEGIQAATIKFARWSDVGADGLVKATVRRAGDATTVEFHLYEVRAAREVLSNGLRGEGAGANRVLAHTIADKVIEYYTREPGVFATRILTLRKTAKSREIVASDVDGGRPEVLYREQGIILLPAWRPDGRAVLFTAYRAGRAELWTLDLATRRVAKLLAVGDVTSGGTYSPDGKLVAFAASRDGNSDVWVANADGSNPHRLTTDPGIDGSPTWSPDGKRIAFVSNRSGNPHLYLMNADGSGQRRLTFQGNYNQTPRWSPRGDLIAFTARDERKVFDIFVVSPDTGRISRVTQNQGRTNEEPTWAPNGRLLAFTSDRNGTPQLVISNLTGDRQTVVTRDEAEIDAPAWGPFHP